MYMMERVGGSGHNHRFLKNHLKRKETCRGGFRIIEGFRFDQITVHTLRIRTNKQTV